MIDINKINNKFESKLILNNYKIFKDNWHKSLRMFQKRIKDEDGRTKYFLNCYHYNFGISFPTEEKRDTYMFKCQFYIDKENKDQTVNLDFSGDFIPSKYSKGLTTLEEVESFFEKMYVQMKADYYE